MWKKNRVLIINISVPSIITLEEPQLFKPCIIELPLVVRVSPLDTFDSNINNEVGEIKIIFISDLKDITFLHYMDQRKSMLCRKLVTDFIEEDFGDFDYNWLPNCLDI